MAQFCLVYLVLLPLVASDVYLNHPRGSNNKLNEQSNNRNNANRLFDSQNNAAAGYQVGDKCEPVCHNENTNNFNSALKGAGEGVMYYYSTSILPLEWTAQHACGPEHMGPKAHCDIIIQYMCDGWQDSSSLAADLRTVEIRDGSTTNTIPDNADTGPPDTQYGMQEPYSYYQKCKTRERNKGLFTADQNMNGRNTAKNTRQDNNGNRYGYECNEERDYYPYWHPSPWIDIAVLTSNTSRCKYYQDESENVKGRGECSMSVPTPTMPNNAAACKAAGGTWTEREAHDVEKPECKEVEWSRDNHHGNGLNGYSNSYNWTVPKLEEEKACILRIRYNISTGDYDGWDMDSKFNDDLSPVKGDERKDFIDADTYSTGPLELAIDTSQFGRTFEDRTHKFIVKPRPDGDWGTIWNFNVRGRRGNIVQVYPAVEYDFVPNMLEITEGDSLHIQWTGSDANANNAGEGKARTDRSNLVELNEMNKNRPMKLEEHKLFIKDNGEPDEETISKLAYLGQDSSTFTGEACGTEQCTCDEEEDDQDDVRNCAKLNMAPAYFDLGYLFKVKKAGSFQVMSTRNNNFSNRSQKAQLKVKAKDSGLSDAAIAAIAASTVVAAAGAGVFLWWLLSTASGLLLLSKMGLRKKRQRIPTDSESGA
ncbi:hypothetical protein CYMTET_43067, partial [Cymbomonas tetramitiformis]